MCGPPTRRRHVLGGRDRGRQVAEPLGDRGDELLGLGVLGLLLRDQPQGLLRPGDARRQLAAVSGELAELAERDAEPVGAALVDSPRAEMEARYTTGTTIGASKRATVSTRRMRVAENNLPSLAALSWVSATCSAARSLSRWARSCALSARVLGLCWPT